MSSKQAPLQHTSALCLIPNPEFWPPIQTIRSKHDRAYKRWMPHINLIYPFCPYSEFENVSKELSKELENIPPFWVSVDDFGHFKQRKAWTVHLKPTTDPGLEIERLQAICEKLILPETKDLDSKKKNQKRPFRPHLTVAQFKKSEAPEEVKVLKSNWEKTFGSHSGAAKFLVSHVYLISRISQTDPFRVRYAIPLKSNNKVPLAVPEALIPISEENEKRDSTNLPPYP